MAFGFLIDLYASSPPAERTLISDVIYTKMIQYRTDVRRRKIKAKPEIDSALDEYFKFRHPAPV